MMRLKAHPTTETIWGRGLTLTLICGTALVPACAAPLANRAPRDFSESNADPASSWRRPPPRIKLLHGRVWLGSKGLDPLPPRALGQAPLLGKVLLQRGREEEESRTCVLDMGDDVDGGQLKSVLKTMETAGWTDARIGAGAPSAMVSVSLGSWEAAWPDSILTAVVRADGVEVWSVPKALPAPADAPAADRSGSLAHPHRLVELQSGDVWVGALDLLQAECQTWSACSPIVLLVGRDASASFVRKFVSAVGAAAAMQHEAAQVQFQFEEPPPAGSAPSVIRPAAARGVHGKSVSSRLPPEEIQRIVRGSSGGFRSCYDEGLRRDPTLEGVVAVHFVIGRDGTVTTAELDRFNSTMPDADVGACVVEHIKALVFPQPEGGIVTVVYPMRFSPAPAQ